MKGRTDHNPTGDPANECSCEDQILLDDDDITIADADISNPPEWLEDNDQHDLSPFGTRFWYEKEFLY